MEQPKCPKIHDVDIIPLARKGFFKALDVKPVELSHSLHQLHPLIIGVLAFLR
jgi:hypothetical protein